MDSSLSLREIQDRLRSGSSVDEVAVEAGVEASELAAYATPIMAEREYIASLARESNVRRSGDSPSHRDLEAVVTEQLRARGVDPQEVVWDAARVERRRWQVLARVQDGSTTRQGVFNFDVDGRFSVAANEDARWMLGELPLPPADPEGEPTLELTERERRARFTVVEGDGDDWDDDPDDGPSDIETLRGMMDDYEQTVSGYEDTLRVLRGFGQDRDDSDEESPDEDAHGPDAPDTDHGRGPAQGRRSPGPAERQVDRARPTGPQDTGPGAGDGTADGDEGRTGSSPARPAASRAAARQRATPPSPQPAATEDRGAPVARRRPPRKRAQVPTWDEIVFGSGGDDQRS